jgi:hypothetical protein
MVTFSDVVDATDNLSVEEQETLVEILRRRIAERNRADLACDVADARAEFRAGNTQTSSVDDIMGEVRGES